MSDVTTLTVERRDRAGKGAARATRRAGRVPGVIYGDRKDPVLIQLDPRDLERELGRGAFMTRVYTLDVAGESHRVLPRDVQFHPVTDWAIHVDFMRVGADTRVSVAVPVQFINHDRSPGLKRGGVLNVVRHEVEMVCRADHIPDHLTIDLTGWDIGDSIHISAIKLPEGTRPRIADRDFTVATVAAPTTQAAEETTTTDAAAAATPAAGATPAAAPAAGGGDKGKR